MNRRSWKVWVAGIALVQLLVIGVQVALWPQPSEAERWAERIRVGLTQEERREWEDGVPTNITCTGIITYVYRFPDGSSLSCSPSASTSDSTNVVVWPGDRVPTLTRLRRTLARAFPILGK
jgi:hypothetical protein